MALFQATIFYRGSTIVFLTTFTDQNGVVINPGSAQVSIVYNTSGGQQRILVSMLAPGSPGGDPTQWFGEWDSRGVLPGTTYWSIHSGTPIPVVVQDGQFQLNANPANLVTF